MQIQNLLTTPTGSPQQEHFETLLENRHSRLLRIVSPPHFRLTLFVQPEDEWVMVLQGEGTLEFPQETVTLKRGDSLLIPAGTEHRVIDTSSEPLCIWLALHLEERSDHRRDEP